MATLRTAALNLLRLAGFQSIRTGMQAVMHDITVLLAMVMRRPNLAKILINLGRPKSNPELAAEAKRLDADDQYQRNAVVAEGFCEAVGKIGQEKRRFGLGLIREKLAVTQGSMIAMNRLVVNHGELLGLLDVLISFWLQILRPSAGSQNANQWSLDFQSAAA
jgi:hypothetical protein